MGVASGSDIPDATQVGSLDTILRFGLLNNPCNSTVAVDSTLYDATTERDDIIDPLPALEPNRLRPLAEDDDQNGVPDAVDRWPSYLTTLGEQANWDFDRLRARLVGVNTTSVSATTIVWNLLVFEPGSRLSPAIAGDAALGYPVLFVLQDSTAPGSPQDPIDDFCAPVSLNLELAAMAGGQPFRTNPTDGVYLFTTFTVSRLDGDFDGIENDLDTCPLTPDPDWDPRSPDLHTAGDTDGDGLADSCDPQSSPGSCQAVVGWCPPDEDHDGWMNRGDNCPLAANEEQEDSDGDGIGDACDPDPFPSGHYHPVCIGTQVLIGAGGAPPPDPLDHYPCNAALIGDLDCDGNLDDRDVLAGLGDFAGAIVAPCINRLPLACDEAAPGALLNLLAAVAGVDDIRVVPCP